MDTITKKLHKSIKNEFYFEALFILASLIENSLKEVTRSGRKRISFEDAINKAKKNNLIPENLANELHRWREDRNTYVHSLISKNIDENSLKSIVIEGKKIFDKIKGIQNV